LTAIALPRARARARALPIPRPELLGLLALAAALNLWALSRNGWANEYYSAAVRSMSTSWHAFLYGSFDSAGAMTVDKPPLALWVQALSVRAFGFHPLAILVPQALMGVATVGLTYDLVRRRFGRLGGFAAGLVLALTPITVAISRHNNPDALLVLCCVAALWCLVRGLEDGRTRWVVLAGVCVGLGFEAKMGAALLIVPALAAAWLWMAPRGRLAATRQLLAGGAAMVVVGGAWPLLVALTPAADRPWVSGTSDNSILSLIFGYNGFGRLDGQAGGPGGGVGGPGGGGFGGGGGPFGGSPGVLRLFNSALGGQGGWLLGFALVAGIGILAASRLRRSDARTGWLIAVGGSFLTIAAAFSLAKGIFHPYYVSQLAPFTAALVGAGAAELIRGGRVTRVVAPLAIAAGVVGELLVIHRGASDEAWLAPLLVVVGAVAAAALAARLPARVRAAAAAAAIAALLIAPASWAVDTLGHAASGTFPAGGPASAAFGGPGGGPAGFGGRFAGRPAGAGFSGGPPGAAGGAPPGAVGGSAGATGAPGGSAGAVGGAPAATGGPGFAGGGMFGGDNQSLTQALAYVPAHGGGTIAVSSQTGAATAIIDSGAKVAGIGGFSGRESDVSISWLAQAVRSGEIRWVLTGGDAPGFGRDGRTGSTTVMAAVQQTCRAVSSVSGLYDCSGRAAALAAAQ
jgi:4-amino-4-deoxy-L-arabinose transferase-like glycosyltransferase